MKIPSYWILTRNTRKMNHPILPGSIKHDQDQIDTHRPTTHEFSPMQSIREPFKPSLLGRPQANGKLGRSCMPRLDFDDQNATAVRRLDQQIQFPPADRKVAGKNPMAAPAKPACSQPLPPASYPNRRWPPSQSYQRLARNRINAMVTIFCSIILMSS